MESNPNFSIVVDEDLFALRWHEVSIESLGRLSARLSARREELGRSLYYIALVPEGTPQPDDTTRDALVGSIAETYPLMSTVRVVILGTGFRATIVRSGMAAMTLMTGLRGHVVKVDKSPREAIEHYAKHAGRDPSPIVQRLLREGLLRADEA